MKKYLAVMAMTALASGAFAQLGPDVRTTTLKGVGGVPSGTVTLMNGPHGVLVRIEAFGLTPGWHAVHFHEKADCSDAAFKTAGAHVHEVTPAVHGLLNHDANDKGDLPNIYAGADGKAIAEVYSDLVMLRGGENKPALLDSDGSALVIHAKADDYMSQPIGGAGDRVACAAIK
jgi:Cu-Zn family superoxide dismutase